MCGEVEESREELFIYLWNQRDRPTEEEGNKRKPDK